jgi:hypothetical protein
MAVQGAVDGRATCNQTGWRFGTWNVGSLCGRSLEVADELWRRRVDVCAVQETRWKSEATKFIGAKGRRYKQAVNWIATNKVWEICPKNMGKIWEFLNAHHDLPLRYKHNN